MPLEHVCKECKQEKPKTVRKIDPRSLKVGAPRCRTHYLALKAAQKKRSHERHVQKEFNLLPGEYERLYKAQGGKCWFPNCRATGKKRKLAVDHDHVTGEVRGLVCYNHNYYLLGMFANDLDDAKAYIEDPPYRRWKEGRGIHVLGIKSQHP
jgi:hypothetical protein